MHKNHNKMCYMASIYNSTKNKKYSICTVLAQINEKKSVMWHKIHFLITYVERRKNPTHLDFFLLAYSMELLSQNINSSPNTFKFSVFCKRNIPWWYVSLLKILFLGFLFCWFVPPCLLINSFLTEKSHVLIEKQNKNSSRSALWERCIPQRKQRLIVPSEAKKTDTWIVFLRICYSKMIWWENFIWQVL